jgi:hypothetical protein
MSQPTRGYTLKLDGLPRSTLALLWALYALRARHAASGATYRGLGALLGTRHRTAVVRCVSEAVTLKLVSVSHGEDLKARVALTGKSIRELGRLVRSHHNEGK